MSDSEVYQAGFADGRRQGIYDVREFIHRCKECGVPHEMRRDPGNEQRWTWEDPTDGHPYRPMLTDEIRNWFTKSWHEIREDVDEFIKARREQVGS